MYVHICMYACIVTYICIYVHTYTHAYVKKNIYIYIYMSVHIYIYVYVYIHIIYLCTHLPSVEVFGSPNTRLSDTARPRESLRGPGERLAESFGEAGSSPWLMHLR